MTARATAAAVAIAVLTVGACGTTYIDTSITVPPTADVPIATWPPVTDDTPSAVVLDEIEELMRHLDEQIVDDDKPAYTMTRIDQLWAVAEPQLRADDPDQLFPYQQALNLARSGVERKRPADASKGYKLLIAAIAAADEQEKSE